MSAAVPYVAPWQSGFEKFATQTYTPTAVAFNQLQLKVADGQWWRIIYLNGNWQTSAVAGTRTVFVRVTASSGTVLFEENAPAGQPPSNSWTYLFGPTLTAFAASADPNAGMAVSTLPDVLWPPRAAIDLMSANPQAGDVWAMPTIFAIEIYTEQRQGVLAPTPTPLLV